MTFPALKKTYDVVILGGGLAGLTLARQLSRERPTTSIFIAEAAAHPPVIAAHKIGESCVEIAGSWFVDTLGLKEHLETEHLPKLGLRFFMPSDNKGDVSTRLEVGPIRNKVPTPFEGLLLPSYQIDRGVLEGHLAEDLTENVTFVDECRVKSIQLGEHDTAHTVEVAKGRERRTVQGRWIVDATGRAAMLRKQLGLTEVSPHKASSVWFRIPQHIKVDDWSDDWAMPMGEPVRWRSTSHFLDTGYWVWLIPLATGNMSVGIVAASDHHKLEDFGTFERATAWLEAHEPQVAAAVTAALGGEAPLDFRVGRQYPVRAKRNFSGERWCLTGDAGSFVDPFYSPGSDFVSIANGATADLIKRYLDGEDVVERADRIQHYFDICYSQFLRVYQDQYTVMGNPQVMAAKVVFDTAFYWGWATLLGRNGVFMDPDFMDTISADVARMIAVQTAAQRFFLEWNEAENLAPKVLAVDQFDVATMWRIYVSLIRPVSGDRLRGRVSSNLDTIEALAEVLFRFATRSNPRVASEPTVDVAKLTLDTSKWDDGLFDGSDRRDEVERVLRETRPLWVDGSQGPSLPAA